MFNMDSIESLNRRTIKFITMVKIKNVGRKAFCGRHHKKALVIRRLVANIKNIMSSPISGLTKYENLQIKLEMACLALGGLELLVRLLKD